MNLETSIRAPAQELRSGFARVSGSRQRLLFRFGNYPAPFPRICSCIAGSILSEELQKDPRAPAVRFDLARPEGPSTQHRRGGPGHASPFRSHEGSMRRPKIQWSRSRVPMKGSKLVLMTCISKDNAGPIIPIIPYLDAHER